MTQQTTFPGPCCICGGENYELSCGGPTICPACDAGHFTSATVMRQAKVIASLRAALASSPPPVATPPVGWVEARERVQNLANIGRAISLTDAEADEIVRAVISAAPRTEPCGGWGVVGKDGLLVRTVSDTRRAAIINWLVTEHRFLIRNTHRDSEIEQLWRDHCGAAQVVPVSITAQVDASTPCGGWKPIASAPKDGTKILSWWNKQAIITHWAERTGFNGWQAPSMMTVAAHDKSAWHPTHWQPLPEPPAPPEAADHSERPLATPFERRILDAQASIVRDANEEYCPECLGPCMRRPRHGDGPNL